MHFAVRNKRVAGFVLALSLLVLPSAGATGDHTLSVADARAEVARAEAHLAAVTADRDATQERLGDMTASTAALVTRVAAARSDLRRQAVGAFVEADPNGMAFAIIAGDDAFDASARMSLRTHSTRRSSSAFERYQKLRDDVAPRFTELAETLEALEQQVVEANDAVLAARANEAEAERQEALRIEAQRAARDAERRAADQAARATTTTAAPTPDTVSANAASPGAAASTGGAATETSPAPAAPAPAPAAPAPTITPAPAGGPSEAQWAALRQCESGGNYQAVSNSGKYRGAYQFDARTWAGLGPAGDPAAAPPAEQDARAKLLYSQRGWRPWPVCGRHLR